MPTDILFYLVCIPGVMLYGIAKGGFGGPMAVLSVPLMSLVMPPAQAAAILLPILVFMDMLVVKTYWGTFDRLALRWLLPSALVGVALGYWSADHFDDDAMRILVGTVALVFGLQTVLALTGTGAREHHPVGATFFGALAGFSSFSIHAGGPR